MAEADAASLGVSAEVPYLRQDLDRVSVKATARLLGPDTVEHRRVEVRDGRRRPRPPTLDQEGFQLARWPSRVARERLDEFVAESLGPREGAPRLQQAYWDETIPLIQSLSGAREVIPQEASGVRLSPRSGNTYWLGPAGWAHIDFEAAQIAELLQASLERVGREVRPFRRYALYQGWRALSPPPQDYPLALCDRRTIAPGDLVPIDYLQNAGGREGAFRSWGSRFSARHEWWYFPDMTIDEMIVFTGFDSARPHDVTPLHVSFDDTAADRPVPRVSYESRYFALFD